MDADIKKYADTLYETAQMDSATRLRELRVETLRDKAARNPANLPLSGVDIQAMMRLYDAHVERCVFARFESYASAFAETSRMPSEEDFNQVLTECKETRDLEVQRSAHSVRQFITSHGPLGTPINIQSQMEHGSAHGYDRVLQRWKIWKARTQLKPMGEERKRAFDALLPTYSRAEFEKDLPSLAVEATPASPLALVFMDLDKFKLINDGPGGHAAGDHALKVFAEVLLSVCAGKGSAYRYGGDELCALLPNHGIDEAVAVAERIRGDMCTIKTKDLPLGLSTSIGVACLPHSAADPSELVRLADQAMYISKRAGGNCVNRIERSEKIDEGAAL